MYSGAENRDFYFLKIIIQKPCVIEERITHHFKGGQMSFKMTCQMTLFSHQYLARKQNLAIFAMEQEYRDRLGHLWEAGIESVQKLVKMTDLGQSTIYKNIKKLKEGDDMKRTPGSGRKRILKENDRR
jgi:hypothetical protein